MIYTTLAARTIVRAAAVIGGWLRMRGIPLRWCALSLVWNGNMVCCALLGFLLCFDEVRLSVLHRWNRVSHCCETDSLTAVRQTGMVRGGRGKEG